MMLVLVSSVCCVFLFKQKTAYEMRISDWSSDVCSSDLLYRRETEVQSTGERSRAIARRTKIDHVALPGENHAECFIRPYSMMTIGVAPHASTSGRRPEEHKSELQSLMRTSYAVSCLIKSHVDVTIIQPPIYTLTP